MLFILKTKGTQKIYFFLGRYTNEKRSRNSENWNTWINCKIYLETHLIRHTNVIFGKYFRKKTKNLLVSENLEGTLPSDFWNS